jgi:hypothetical protein
MEVRVVTWEGEGTGRIIIGLGLKNGFYSRGGIKMPDGNIGLRTNSWTNRDCVCIIGFLF